VNLPKLSGLKAKHLRFVHAMASGLSERDAYLAAGYKCLPKSAEREGLRLCTRPDVAMALAEVRREAAKAAGIDSEWVMTSLRTVVERCMQVEPVLNREGNPIGVYRFDAPGALRGLELIGKQQGMFADRLKISEEASLDDDELAARIAALTGRTATAVAAPH
jgi:phage terminase small subunit